MAKPIKAIAIVTLVAGGVAASIVVLRGAGRERLSATRGESDGPTYDTEAELGTVASVSPDGEWWGKTKDLLIRVRLAEGRGHVAVARGETDTVFQIRIIFPDEQIDARKIAYHVWSSEHEDTWHGRIPQLESWRPGVPFKSKPGDGVIHRMVIENIYGSFGSDIEPFTLRLMARHSLKERCTDAEVRVFARLGQLLRKAAKAQ
jgi:hypothetical protein